MTTSSDFSYFSADPSRGSISSSGLYTASSTVGTDIVWVSDGNIESNRAKINIIPLTVASLTIINAPTDIKMSYEKQLDVSVVYDDGSAESPFPDSSAIQWLSDDNTIASVNNGLLEAYKLGNVEITAQFGGAIDKAVVNVSKGPLRYNGRLYAHLLDRGRAGYAHLTYCNNLGEYGISDWQPMSETIRDETFSMVDNFNLASDALDYGWPDPTVSLGADYHTGTAWFYLPFGKANYAIFQYQKQYYFTWWTKSFYYICVTPDRTLTL